MFETEMLEFRLNYKNKSMKTRMKKFILRMYRQQNQGQGFDFAGEAEKAARSVFVGNIPYEATEEQLKDIFSEVGVVVSFRLVYDRESGKPKGILYCFR